MDASLLYDARALLGEGALWSNDKKQLFWVDIEGGFFNIFDPVTGVNLPYKLGKRVGTVVQAGADHVLLALEDGIALLDLKTGEVEYKIITTIHHHNKRFNDGKCDPEGRFWVGSMSLNDEPEAGALYCITDDFTLTEKISKVSISNGIAWNADGSKMYYVDTPTKKVVQFDYDRASANITNKKTIIEMPDGMGYPDGMTIDEEGMLWIALWDGFGVARFNPLNGQLMEKITLPVPKVTSCAFGGSDLKTLFITTARAEMDNEQLEKYPLSGSIFVANTYVSGVPAYKFNLNSFD
jgi:sugar lactone lactonase YvrE